MPLRPFIGHLPPQSLRTHRLALLVSCLLSGLILPVHAQQLINGSRTVAGAFNACLATGATNAYVCTLSPPITAYQPSQCFLVTANTSNTGVATLNVNGLGTRPLKKWVDGVLTDLAANDIGTGQLFEACYDGTVLHTQPLGNIGSGTLITNGGGLVCLTKIANATGIAGADVLVSTTPKVIIAPDATLCKALIQNTSTTQAVRCRGPEDVAAVSATAGLMLRPGAVLTLDEEARSGLNCIGDTSATADASLSVLVIKP